MNLIIFDIDGTLTASESQHQLAFVNAMKEFGIENIDTNWKEYKHHTDSFILKENYENNLDKSFDFKFINAFEKKMTELILSLKKVREIKGAKELIEYLMNRNDYVFSFATGSLLQAAFVKLNQAEIEYKPELVVGSNNIYEREGIVNEAILRAKHFHKIDSFENIISIGDGIWDLKTARNLNLHFVGVGDKNKADFDRENIKIHTKDWADFNISSMEEKLGIN